MSVIKQQSEIYINLLIIRHSIMHFKFYFRDLKVLKISLFIQHLDICDIAHMQTILRLIYHTIDIADIINMICQAYKYLAEYDKYQKKSFIVVRQKKLPTYFYDIFNFWSIESLQNRIIFLIGLLLRGRFFVQIKSIPILTKYKLDILIFCVE